MKKNAKIGIGLAVISVVSLAAVNPVFTDVRPGYIETTGTVVSANSTNSVDEQAIVVDDKIEEYKDDNGFDETSIACPDFEKSPNFCKLKFDAKSLEKLCPEVDPSDYEDEDIRALASEYADKGYFLTDCKDEATMHASGTGGQMYVFCNGFTAVDDTTGNNTCFCEVVKATPEEFKWFIATIDNGSFEVSKEGSVETYKSEDACQTFTYKYDSAKQIMQIAIEFKISNGVG